VQEASDHNEETKFQMTGWRLSYGWLISLSAFPNAEDFREKHYRHTETYQEAVTVRNQELKTGRYQFATIIMKTGNRA
jgi:hypothetical protein